MCKQCEHFTPRHTSAVQREQARERECGRLSAARRSVCNAIGQTHGVNVGHAKHCVHERCPRRGVRNQQQHVVWAQARIVSHCSKQLIAEYLQLPRLAVRVMNAQRRITFGYRQRRGDVGVLRQFTLYRGQQRRRSTGGDAERREGRTSVVKRRQEFATLGREGDRECM